MFWLVVAVKTIKGALNGSLFIAPDLVGLKEKSRREDVEPGVVVAAS